MIKWLEDFSFSSDKVPFPVFFDLRRNETQLDAHFRLSSTHVVEVNFFLQPQPLNTALAVA